MDKKYQIFISSTFKDLEVERRVVIEQILNMSHIPIGMEVFQAADEPQWGYIRKRIIESDYYIVILAERYGSEGPDGKSYTQMEYEYAIENNIPTLAFLLHDECRRTWPRDKVEFDKREKLNDFRKLCETKLCKHWKNSDDLGGKVAVSLMNLFKEQPRAGWIRGSSVAHFSSTHIQTKSTDENLDTKEPTKSAKSDIRHNSPNNKLINLLKKKSYKLNRDKEISLLDIVTGAVKHFTGNIHTHQAREIINNYVIRNHGFNMSEGDIKDVLVNLEFYRIIETVKTEGSLILSLIGSIGDKAVYATKFGKDLIMEIELKYENE